MQVSIDTTLHTIIIILFYYRRVTSTLTPENKVVILMVISNLAFNQHDVDTSSNFLPLLKDVHLLGAEIWGATIEASKAQHTLSWKWPQNIVYLDLEIPWYYIHNRSCMMAQTSWSHTVLTSAQPISWSWVDAYIEGSSARSPWFRLIQSNLSIGQQASCQWTPPDICNAVTTLVSLPCFPGSPYLCFKQLPG